MTEIKDRGMKTIRLEPRRSLLRKLTLPLPNGWSLTWTVDKNGKTHNMLLRVK